MKTTASAFKPTASVFAAFSPVTATTGAMDAPYYSAAGHAASAMSLTAEQMRKSLKDFDPSKDIHRGPVSARSNKTSNSNKQHQGNHSEAEPGVQLPKERLQNEAGAIH